MCENINNKKPKRKGERKENQPTLFQYYKR